MKAKIKNANIYAALGICAVAVAVAALVSFGKDNGKPTVKNPDFSRITVRWSDTFEEETAPQTYAVDIGVTGVPDERETEEEVLKKTEGFALPMGNDIIKDFSGGEMVFSKTMGDWRVHDGIDFGGAAGNTVDAVADGRIMKVYDDIFWGTVVEIDHGDSMTVRYCGLKKGTTLPEGSLVKKSEKIGTLGSIPIESADGDHLHLEVISDGKIVDPLEAMNKVRSEE